MTRRPHNGRYIPLDFADLNLKLQFTYKQELKLINSNENEAGIFFPITCHKNLYQSPPHILLLNSLIEERKKEGIKLSDRVPWHKVFQPNGDLHTLEFIKIALGIEKTVSIKFW